MKAVISSALFLVVFLATERARGAAYVPTNPGQVLETLRATAFDPTVHEIRQLRTQLDANPTNVTLACEFARRCIERSRSEADPRYLGRAQAALEPWWNSASPPVNALVLRATIKQSQHEFTNALADLDAAVHLAPRNGQIWLTRATILTVLGDYKAARKACVPLAELAPGLIAMTAVVNVTSLNGNAESSCALLRNALERDPSAGGSEKIWALTVLGETAARLGHGPEAESDFKSALALGQRDPYLLGAYADLLLEENRPQEAAELLKNENRADALLLRLALAESALAPRPETYLAHIEALKARFEAGHLRGDFVHQREESLFYLRLLNQPEQALRLAEANWQVQHEPADILILVQSAIAAGHPEVAQPAFDFVRTNHLESVQIAKLEKEGGAK
jgi:predicted Zn-dependent protease